MSKAIWLEDWEKVELLPEATAVHQVDDGTLFYHTFSSPERLYVKRKGKELDAELPEGTIVGLHAHYSDIYFCVTFKIYRARFSTSDGITVTFLRDRLNHEAMYDTGLCSRRRYNKIHVYRMSDDPDRDGIVSAVTNLEDYDFMGFHQSGSQGKIVFARESLKDTTVSCYDDERTIYLELPAGYLLPTSWPCFSRLLYLIHGETLNVYDTSTDKFLPPLGIADTIVQSFVGVHNGVITVQDTDCYLQTHILPDAYFQIIYHGEPINVQELIDRNEEIEAAGILWRKEKDELTRRNRDLEEMLVEWKVGALQSAKKSLKFQDLEKLTKPLICIQLENGTFLYFDNAKPFELFTMKDGAQEIVDLHLLDGEYDCSFRGSIGNTAYFSAIRGKTIKFFKATAEIDTIEFAQVNEMRTSELSLFNNQPLYFIERAKEWSIYQYHENYTELEGETFDISEIDLLSKYERHYLRGVLYLFRETSTAAVKRMNDKVVIVEGPLLDVTSFYTPAHSHCIYIVNRDHNVLLILDTTNLRVSQLNYEPPADSNNHSIVGIHDGILTMAFDGVWGRNLSTTRMP